MATSPKPTIVFIHGAFSTPVFFEPITTALQAASYEVLTPQLPTADLTPGKDVNDDIAVIHATIKPLLEAGKEIVFVAHSQGGNSGCMAVEGNSVAERRARGEKGGVKSILFIAAAMAPRRGMNQSEIWALIEQDNSCIEVSPEACSLTPLAKQRFFNDLPAPEADEWFATMRPQWMGSYITPLTFIPSDLKIPAFYLYCEDDKMMIPKFQDVLTEGAPNVKVVKIKAGHFPFISRVRESFEVIEQVAKA